MAKSNVPRALVQLMDGASDQTMEQIVVALNRMANEPSVRGSLIQQGVLTDDSTLVLSQVSQHRHGFGRQGLVLLLMTDLVA